jgi:hypothetical protein
MKARIDNKWRSVKWVAYEVGGKVCVIPADKVTGVMFNDNAITISNDSK